MDKNGLTRRRFLQTSGLTIAGTAAIASSGALMTSDRAWAAKPPPNVSTFDGSIIYADTYKDRSKLFRVDGEEGRRKQLTRDSRMDIHPSIDPFNWDRIVFSSRHALGFELRIIEPR